MNARIKVRTILATLAGAAWICAAAAPSQAKESPAAFYKGKTVRFIVGYGPGGGFDTYARMMAPYLSKALGAHVVVENKPGAGGIAALNDLVAAPPDGLEIMHLNGTTAALGQLVGVSGVHYDLRKLGYLGTVTPATFVWLGSLHTPIKTPQDAINYHKRISWAATGTIDSTFAGARFTCKALALDCSIVPGYPGTNAAALAVGKGEMDALHVSDTSANNYVKAKEGRVVATLAHKRSRLFPNTPTIFEALKLNPDQKWLLDYIATVAQLEKILVAPPNVPAARLAYLQAAVKKVLTTPALIAQGKRTQFFIRYRDAKATRAAVLKLLETITPEQRRRVKKLLTTNTR